ncbi:hypothetical protein L1987_50615 [Smallanthus sonchifolius]|uniref:Uncharacterized protein n=1 Tax=Smallanthus sonchifolius TaxID=185202 RepID=A0ACB9EMJ1_9ASTR|nr:hypothetical protein L1987_50615 [Smallanthus sonchifolius]
MVNLFDLNTSVGGNKLLTDKPHHDGSSFSRRLVDDQMDDKVIVSDLRKSPSNKKSNYTPIKMLIAQEMSKEEDSKQSPSNLVAKLMGLDALPRRSQSGSLEFLQQEHGFMNTQSKHEINQYQEQGEYKDVYETCQNDSPLKGKCSDKQKMVLVREKFMEAKRLSTDEKLRQTKQFQDALEVLSSNKDAFLKFLQEPNSLFSQNIYNLQSVPPPPESRRITILKPSKLVDNEKQAWNNNGVGSDILFSPECCKIDDNPNQPTRIVILKPSSVKPHDIKAVSSSPSNSTSHGVFDEDSEEIANEISDNLSELRRDETLVSSVYSNGYIGDDSSYCKSEIDYATVNLSDSEVVSPASRHSWDYVNRFDSHYCTSSSRTSYSHESSVCREAKKRLSERWAMISNKNVLEQRQIQRSSSTLGDMLALSDLKKPVKPEENHETSDLIKAEDADKGSRNLLRSKSVPARLGVEVSGSLKDKAPDDTEDVVKEKLVKSSSFKGRVSSLFSKNKKSSKEKSHQSNNVSQSTRFPFKNVGIGGSQCIGDMVSEEASCSGLKKSIILPEAGYSFTKPEFFGSHIANQDQPSPISVLEPQFEEDDHTTNCYYNSKPNKYGIEPMRYNLIDKSPPIGSIARTLSWDDSAGSATPCSSKPSSTPLNPEEEEQECLSYVQTLLSVAGLSQIRSNSFLGKWQSPESPLDPSMRDKYMNPSQKEPMLDQTKLRYHRSITKLVFDCVNEALIDIAGRGPYTGAHNNVVDMTLSSTALMDRVWGQMKEWIWLEERCDWEDGSMVVMKEVVGRGWVEGLRMEIDNTRKEIERKLLEELVQESVLELTGRA